MPIHHIQSQRCEDTTGKVRGRAGYIEPQVAPRFTIWGACGLKLDESRALERQVHSACRILSPCLPRYPYAEHGSAHVSAGSSGRNCADRLGNSRQHTPLSREREAE